MAGSWKPSKLINLVAPILIFTKRERDLIYISNMSTKINRQMSDQIQKLCELLDEEKFTSNTEGRSKDHQIPYVFTNILQCLSDRLAEIEEKLDITD